MTKSYSNCLLRWTLIVAGFAAGSVAIADDPVRGEQQMVVAANPHATEAGIRILRQGGSAVDAAIAVQLVLSLVEPQSSGIGGGAFMLHLDPAAADWADAVTLYSGRETAPAAAGPDTFRGGAFYGGLPVGVPGVMRMLEMAHRDHGRLPWADLFVPAIELAENGFEISPRLYFLLDRARSAADASFRDHYLDESGDPHATGHLLVNQEYAATLHLLAAGGAEPMYSGELAQRIIERVHDNAVGEGLMTLEDLAGYRAEKLAALCTDYRRWRVCGPRLPSSGGIAVQQMLKLIERFDMPALGDDPVRAIHLVAEAGALAFADRNLYMADPDFVDVPADALLDPLYLRERSGLIDPERAMGPVAAGVPERAAAAAQYAPSPLSELTSTSHFSIVDRYGGAVSMTSSVQGAFGSQLMVGGFILNNQLTDFAFNPEVDGRPVANRVEGGKRPLSSMTPSMAFDSEGRLKLLIGSPGGTRIIGFVAQAIIGVLDWELNIQDAVAAPHYLSRGGSIELEQGTALADYADALTAMGHQIALRGLNSGLHGIVVDYFDDGRVLYGGVDPRREGLALAD